MHFTDFSPDKKPAIRHPDFLYAASGFVTGTFINSINKNRLYFNRISLSRFATTRNYSVHVTSTSTAAGGGIMSGACPAPPLAGPRSHSRRKHR
jgi:hypothetical protein